MPALSDTRPPSKAPPGPAGGPSGETADKPGSREARRFAQISASAGSGKTYALTRRFLELLQGASPLASHGGCAAFCAERGYALAEILAATFTNKAAAEMKSRIVSSLKSAALAERAESAAQREDAPNADGLRRTGGRSAEAWVAAILRHYNSLNIRTIDSLLVTLVRLSALQLDLHPDFEPCFEKEEYFTPYYDALMDDLARDAGEDSLKDDPVFYITDGTGLRAGLEEACRSLVLHAETRGFTPKGRLHDALHSLVARLLTGEEVPLMDPVRLKKRVHALHGNLRNASAAMLESIRAENLAAAKNFVVFLERCAGESSAFAAPPASAYIQKAELDENLNKASKGAASPKAEKAFLTLQGAYLAFARALPLLKHALQLAPLVVLAHEIFARMQARANDTPLLPAIRLPMLAGQVLGGEFGVSDALCRLGSRLMHILLDEFQDTSREQWAAIQPLVLEALAQGGTFAYVGDVKQAIYSWRGGDSRLFDAAVHDEELLAVAPHPVLENLPFNWRSHPDIVAHNNAFFSLLRSKDIARRTLAAMLPAHTPGHYLEEAATEAVRIFSGVEQRIPPQWEAARATPAQDRQDLPRSRVCLYTVEGAHNPAVEALLRPRLERLLQEILSGRRFRDVAILVRSGEEASLAAEWLSAWNLPVVTENSFLPAEHPLVRRLIAFLTFLDYPLDDAAFWEFLSGPECFGAASGLTPWELTDWLAEAVRTGPQSRPPLYQLFQRDFPLLWQAWIAPFHSQAGLMSAYDLLMEILRRYGLEAHVVGKEKSVEAMLQERGAAPHPARGLQPGLPRPSGQWRSRGVKNLSQCDADRTLAPAIGSDFGAGGQPRSYSHDEEFRIAAAVPTPGMAEQAVAGQRPFLRRLLEVAHLAETRGLSSLASFLAFWKSDGVDEKLPLPESMDAIRIMTIHKAKGLEFPVVVLPFHHRGKRHDPGLAVTHEGGLPLLTRAGRELEDEYYPACITDELERLNLLYVAWTRPTEELHAFITRPASSIAFSPLLRGLSVLLEEYAATAPELCRWERVEETPLPQEDAAGFLAFSETADTHAAGTAPILPTLPEEHPNCGVKGAQPPCGVRGSAPLAQDGFDKIAFPGAIPAPLPPIPWRPMDWLPRLKIYRSTLEDTDFSPVRRGILAHLCLEHLALPPLKGRGEADPQAIALAVERAVHLGMRLFPLPLKEPEVVAQAMRENLAWFASRRDAALWLEKGLREQSIIDARGALHRVDLLVDAGDHLLAVDYKTGQVREEYREQVTRYMTLLAAAQPLPVRGVLVYLDERRMEEVVL